MNTLLNKNVLITGASSFIGLGAKIAEVCWNEGASLLLTGRNRENLTKIKNDLKKSSHNKEQKIFVFPCDMLDRDYVDQIVKACALFHFSVTSLVNNAAEQGLMKELRMYDKEDWDSLEKTFRVNLIVPLQLMSYFGFMMTLKDMEIKGGSIVNISGGGATSSRKYYTPYSLSKTAIVRATESYADELEGKVRVNAIAPGAMFTNMIREPLFNKDLPKEEENFWRKKIEGGDTTQETILNAAKLVAYLLSDDSSHINGRIISAAWDKWDHITEDDMKFKDYLKLRRNIKKEINK